MKEIMKEHGGLLVTVAVTIWHPYDHIFCSNRFGWKPWNRKDHSSAYEYGWD